VWEKPLHLPLQHDQSYATKEIAAFERNISLSRGEECTISSPAINRSTTI
jgi:hypothetical protein